MKLCKTSVFKHFMWSISDLRCWKMSQMISPMLSRSLYVGSKIVYFGFSTPLSFILQRLLRKEVVKHKHWNFCRLSLLCRFEVRFTLANAHSWWRDPMQQNHHIGSAWAHTVFQLPLADSADGHWYQVILTHPLFWCGKLKYCIRLKNLWSLLG